MTIMQIQHLDITDSVEVFEWRPTQKLATSGGRIRRWVQRALIELAELAGASIAIENRSVKISTIDTEHVARAIYEQVEDFAGSWARYQRSARAIIIGSDVLRDAYKKADGHGFMRADLLLTIHGERELRGVPIWVCPWVRGWAIV